MERKIGEIFNYQDNWYQCIENTGYGCIICHFNTHNNICCNNVLNIIGNCLPPYRKDYKSVVFRKLEKVGEPTMLGGKLVQKILKTDRYSCNGCCFESPECDKADNDLCCEYEIYVEIKQNKENMEEREYSEEDMKNNPRFKHHKNIEQVINMQKMKPFDLEAAKAGKPVCTRDGRKARIICFDRKLLFKGISYPIIALVEDTAKEETVYGYNEKGKVMIEDDATYKDDLMMLPQKKEGWIIIHKEAIYDKETAEKIARETTANVIRIQKIEWEE